MISPARQTPPTRGPVFPDAVFEPAQPHLRKLDAFISGQAAVFTPEIRDMAAGCLNNGGKRLRPLLMFYSGWTPDGEPPEAMIRAAAVIEMIHLATLMHDDVLDGGKVRRHTATAPARYGVPTAVLLGDAFFARALEMAAESLSLDMCRMIAAAARRLCAGEIRQTARQGNPRLELREYFRIIEDKTAELFRLSAFFGASLAGHQAPFPAAAAACGRHLGMAYQIFDDLADCLGSEASFGKNLGTDLAEGRYTLPVLLLLRKNQDAERSDLLAQIEKDSRNPGKLRQRFLESGVLEETRKHLEREIEEAGQALAPHGAHPAAVQLNAIIHLARSNLKHLFH